MAAASPLRAFKTAAALRSWFLRHHATKSELLLRTFKVHAADRGVTYKQALDEALCFGWIDGIRRSVDADSFSTRLTPRQPRSIWSRVNIAHVARLIEAGADDAVRPRCLREARREANGGLLVREPCAKVLPPAVREDVPRPQEGVGLLPGAGAVVQAHDAHWVLSAKQEATQRRRLEALVACCARGETIPQLQKKKA